MRWLALPLLLAACGPAPMAEPQNACAAPDLIGHPLTDLPSAGGWGTLRVIHPGDAVTEDFSATRLNVYVDENAVIRNLTCG